MRRELLRSSLTVACIGLGALFLTAAPAWTASEPPQETEGSGVDTAIVTFDSVGSSIHAFVAKPKNAAKHPAIIVVHDIQGLTDDIRDSAQKFAAEGFVAIAPDLLSRSGGTMSPEQSTAMIRALMPMDTVADLQSSFDYLQKSPDVDPAKISVVGFGWGGWRSLVLASVTPNLYRTVVYSGATPVDGLEGIRTPVLGNYGQYDYQNAGDTIWTTKTMKDLGKKYTSYIYPKAMSGFYNSKSRQYDADAAKIAWTRTVEFLKS